MIGAADDDIAAVDPRAPAGKPGVGEHEPRGRRRRHRHHDTRRLVDQHAHLRRDGTAWPGRDDTARVRGDAARRDRIGLTGSGRRAIGQYDFVRANRSSPQQRERLAIVRATRARHDERPRQRRGILENARVGAVVDRTQRRLGRRRSRRQHDEAHAEQGAGRSQQHGDGGQRLAAVQRQRVLSKAGDERAAGADRSRDLRDTPRREAVVAVRLSQTKEQPHLIRDHHARGADVRLQPCHRGRSRIEPARVANRQIRGERRERRQLDGDERDAPARVAGDEPATQEPGGGGEAGESRDILGGK